MTYASDQQEITYGSNQIYREIKQAHLTGITIEGRIICTSQHVTACTIMLLQRYHLNTLISLLLFRSNRFPTQMSSTTFPLNQPIEIELVLSKSLKLDATYTSCGSNKLVVFVHGSGSTHLSPRNQYVARQLNDSNISTLLCDLLSVSEVRADEVDAHIRFDIPYISKRLNDLLDAFHNQYNIRGHRIGLFGASTGAAAALSVAAQRNDIYAGMQYMHIYDAMLI